jgi:hypothetical protein
MRNGRPPVFRTDSPLSCAGLHQYQISPGVSCRRYSGSFERPIEGVPKKHSAFAAAHEPGDASALLDDPLVHCYSGKQLVLTYISRQTLMDYFPGPRRLAH